MYLADFKYGTPAISEVTIVKETDKTFIVADEKAVLNHRVLWGKQVRKGYDHHYFNTLAEALLYLYEEGEKYVKGLQEDLEKAEKMLAELGETMLAAQEKGV